MDGKSLNINDLSDFVSGEIGSLKLKESAVKLPYSYERISSIINPHKLMLLDLEKIEHRKKLTRASGKEDLEDWRDAMERGFLHFKLDLSSKDFLENIDLSYLLYNANMDSTRKANRGDIEEKIKSKKEDFVIYYYPEGRFEYHYDKKYDFVWVNFTETSFSDKHFDIRPSFQKEIFTIIKGRWVGGIASLISSYIKVDSA